MINLSFRKMAFLGAALCFLLMAAALYFQHGLGLEPCPLCVLQRIGMISLGVVLFVAAMHNPKQLVLRCIYSVLAILAALFGVLISGRHVWLQHLPADKVPDCGPGYEYIMDVFSVFDGLSMILSGSGECADVDWQFLTLSMPEWTLITFVVAIIVSIYMLAIQVKFK